MLSTLAATEVCKRFSATRCSVAMVTPDQTSPKAPSPIFASTR